MARGVPVLYKRFIFLIAVMGFLVLNVGCRNSDVIVNSDNERVKYTVTFNVCGGVLSDGNEIVFYGGDNVELPVPYREGYTFAGWFRDPECTGARFYYIDSDYSNSNYEFWAKWEKNDDAQHESGAVYHITYILNNGTFTDGTNENDSYEVGKEKILPVPKRYGYRFAGWYEDENFSGDPVYRLSETSMGDKTFYALWEKLPDTGEPDNPGQDNPVIPDEPDSDNPEKPEEPKSYSIVFNLNGGKFTDGVYVPDKYITGERIVLPVPVCEGHIFAGWYEDKNFSGEEIKEIPANAEGNKYFYAKWTKSEEEHLIAIKAFGGGKESAYVEIEPIDNIGADGYSVFYRADGETDWQRLDGELVRFSGSVIRADVTGVCAGNYSIKIEAAGDSVTLTDIIVKAYERTGDAFKNLKSLGGYYIDGKKRDEATVIYVSESNKNTVQAKIGGKTYTGIARILAAASESRVPLIVRVIGRVSAASWKHLDYDSSNTYNGKPLLGSLDQSALIEQGYNSLDTEEATVLEGLKSSIELKDESFDSYWNMCEISKAGNITIEGVGDDAEINSWGFAFKNCGYIEVRNLKFCDYPENACLLSGNFPDSDNSHIWIHDNYFGEGKNNWNVSPYAEKVFGDGALIINNVSGVSSDNNFISASQTANKFNRYFLYGNIAKVLRWWYNEFKLWT